MTSAKYAPLAEHLRMESRQELTMSFADVEAILGRKLPPSAGGDYARHWWANTRTHSQGQGWLDAGWRVESVDAAQERVRFRRTAAAAGVSEASRPFVFDDTSRLSGAARRMIADYVEEKGCTPDEAMAALLNETALERRRKVIEWFSARARPQTTSSVDLIREDRDSR